MSESTFQASSLLFLHAQTGLHPGSGTALGTVDMPVQRERHTAWPTIPGSALKGVLRDRCREKMKSQYDGSRSEANQKNPDLVAAFGPETVDGDSAHAGALAVTDARCIAFPVRSLRGVFAWVTCPNALVRLGRDLLMAGMAKLPGLSTNVTDTSALFAEDSLLKVDQNKVVLEEFEFTRIGDANPIAEWMSKHATNDAPTAARLKKNLVVLSDDYFTHFVKHATEIVARIGLNYDTKTVKKGALFYQELIPPETLFYSLVLANPSRRKDCPKTASDIVKFLELQLPPSSVLQIGGDETIGKGLCLAHLTRGKGATS